MNINSLFSLTGSVYSSSRLQYKKSEFFSKNVSDLLQDIKTKNKPFVSDDGKYKKQISEAKELISDLTKDASSLFSNAFATKKLNFNDVKNKVDNVTGNVDNMVASFNDILKKINEKPLFSESLSLSKQARMIGKNEDLQKIGITQDNQGSFSVDKKKLENAVKNDSKLVNSVLNSDDGLFSKMKDFAMKTMNISTKKVVDSYLKKNDTPKVEDASKNTNNKIRNNYRELNNRASIELMNKNNNNSYGENIGYSLNTLG